MALAISISSQEEGLLTRKSFHTMSSNHSFDVSLSQTLGLAIIGAWYLGLTGFPNRNFLANFRRAAGAVSGTQITY